MGVAAAKDSGESYFGQSSSSMGFGNKEFRKSLNGDFFPNGNLKPPEFENINKGVIIYCIWPNSYTQI